MVTTKDLRGLLADRFKLKMHRESKETQGYALVAAKNGPKLLSARETSVHTSMRRTPLSPGQTTFVGQNASMTALAELLASFGMGPVVDTTNILGTYDFSLTFGSESISVAGRKDERPAPVQEGTGPSLFTALQEQLGLQLVSQKLSAEYLVVDSVEKPSAN